MITVIMPYFENRNMLDVHFSYWNRYPETVAGLSLIIIDDCSHKHPLRDRVSWPGFVQAYEILDSIKWNQHGARNLGAHVARQQNRDWILLTDIDHVLGPVAAEKLQSRPLDPAVFYTFNRKYQTPRRKSSVHPNTFLLTPEQFWAIGGYDEDYCGTYGGDRPFRHALESRYRKQHFDDIVFDAYEECDIQDAETLDWSREEDHRRYEAIRASKQLAGDLTPKNPIRFSWRRIH